MDFTTLMEQVETLNGKKLPDEAHSLIADHIARTIRVAQGAMMQERHENHCAQLSELGLLERFPTPTYLARDMGEALLAAERERDTLSELRTRLALIENAARRVANDYSNTSWNVGAINALINAVNNQGAPTANKARDTEKFRNRIGNETQNQNFTI